MALLRLIPLLIILFLSAEALSLSDLFRLIYENRLLKSEYQLARTSHIYTLFDLVNKRVKIKAKGIILKELAIEEFDLWGMPIQPKPLTLRKKASFLKPKKLRVKPMENLKDSPTEIKFLGIEDMPTAYRLNMDDEIYIFIRPKGTGWVSGFLTLVYNIKSTLISRPIGMLWNGLHKKPYTELNISLSPEDARSLYWVLTEGASCIIYVLPSPTSDLRTQGWSPYRRLALLGESDTPLLPSPQEGDNGEG